MTRTYLNESGHLRWNADDRLTGAGSYGNYWTSTLDDGRPYNAYVFNFNRDTAQTSGDSRSNGYPVRPVYAAPAE